MNYGISLMLVGDYDSEIIHFTKEEHSKSQDLDSMK